MKRLLLPVLACTLLAGCVVHSVAPPPPMAAPVRAFYYGEHALPDGGWCYVDGPHEHDFFPGRPEHYVVEHGYYVWRGPVAVTYYAGHPLPGGGWCFIGGPHVHEFFPPRDEAWVFRPGHGYLYRGQYSAVRPPPPHYWARPIAPPVRRVPANLARPVGPAQTHAASPAPPASYAPAPPAHGAPPHAIAAPAPPAHVGPVPARPAGPAQSAIAAPGASPAAPGHGNNLPPGHGGAPPGQAVKPAAPAKPANPHDHKKHDDDGRPQRLEK